MPSRGALLGAAGGLARGPTYLRVTTPVNLDLALEGLVRKVLREQPKQEDIYSFAAEYFETLLEIRDRAEDPNSQISDIVANRSEAEATELIKLATSFAKPDFLRNSVPAIAAAAAVQEELCQVVDIDQIPKSSEEENVLRAADDVEETEEDNVTQEEVIEENSSLENDTQDDEVKAEKEEDGLEKEIFTEETQNKSDEPSEGDIIVTANAEEGEEREAAKESIPEVAEGKSITENAEEPEERTEGELTEEDGNTEKIEEENKKENQQIVEIPSEENNAEVNSEKLTENSEIETLDVTPELAEKDEKSENNDDAGVIIEEKLDDSERAEKNDNVTEDSITQNDENNENNEIVKEADEVSVPDIQNDVIQDKTDEGNEDDQELPVEDSQTLDTEFFEGDTTEGTKDVNSDMIASEAESQGASLSETVQDPSAELILSEKGETEENLETERDIIKEFIDREKEFSTMGNLTRSLEVAEVYENEAIAIENEIPLNSLELSDNREGEEEVTEDGADGSLLQKDDSGNVTASEEVRERSGDVEEETSESERNAVSENLGEKEMESELPKRTGGIIGGITTAVSAGAALLKAGKKTGGEIVEPPERDFNEEAEKPSEESNSETQEETLTEEKTNEESLIAEPSENPENQADQQLNDENGESSSSPKGSRKKREIGSENGSADSNLLPEGERNVSNSVESLEQQRANNEEQAEKDVEMLEEETEETSSVQKIIEDVVQIQESTEISQDLAAVEDGRTDTATVLVEEPDNGDTATSILETVKESEEPMLEAVTTIEVPEQQVGDILGEDNVTPPEESVESSLAAELTQHDTVTNAETDQNVPETEGQEPKHLADVVEEASAMVTEVLQEATKESEKDSEENIEESETIPEDSIEAGVLREDTKESENVDTEENKEENETILADFVEAEVLQEATKETEKDSEETRPENGILPEESENVDTEKNKDENETLLIDSVEAEFLQEATKESVEDTEENKKENEPVDSVEEKVAGLSMWKDESGSQSSKDTESLDDENPFISAEVRTLVQEQVPTVSEVDNEDSPEDESDVIVPLNADIGTIEEADEGQWAAQMTMVKAAMTIQKNFRRYLQRKRGDTAEEQVSKPTESEAISEKFDKRESSLKESSSTDSSLSSSATKIQQNGRTAEFSRSNTTIETITTHSFSEIKTMSEETTSRTKSLSTSRNAVPDSEVWSALEQELDSAATTIQHTFKDYRTRKQNQLRREDAVQITTASEDSPTESPKSHSRLLGTGELHDVIVPEEN